MAATTSTGPLSDEPANPEIREELSLPPKSYADAAHAALDEDKHEGSSAGNSPDRRNSHNGRNDSGYHSPQDHSPVVASAGGPSTTGVNGTASPRDKEHSSTEEYASAKDGLEDHVSSNGSTLVTVETDSKEVHHEEQQSQANAPLESGRQAGAGWGRSA
jgi:hypothetical protein